MPAKRKPLNKSSAPGSANDSTRRRVPIHASRDTMTVKGQDPNYIYRWVNDIKEGTRIQKFIDAGYEFVEKDSIDAVGDNMPGTEAPADSRVSKVVGTDTTAAKPVRAYLMRIKRSWYEEDQEDKQRMIDETERGIISRGGLPDGENINDGYYGEIRLTKK